MATPPHVIFGDNADATKATTTVAYEIKKIDTTDEATLKVSDGYALML